VPSGHGRGPRGSTSSADVTYSTEVHEARTLGHRPSLDGLRGVAILLVVAAHAGVLGGGTLGVDLFFVLSGFLITTLLLEEHASTGAISLRAFYVRRAARLLPALWLLLAAYALYASLAGGSLGSAGHVAGATAIGLGYVANFFAAAWSPAQCHYLAHLWSLAEEEQFYVLWPLALVVLLRREVRMAAVVRALGVLVVAVAVERWVLLATGASPFRIGFAPDTNLDALLIGCGAGILWSRGRVAVPGRVAATALAAAALAVGVAPLVVSSNRADLISAVCPVFPLACAAVLVHVTDRGSGLAGRALTLRPLRAVGRVSYGIYLWHFPLMHLAGVPAGLLLTAVVVPVSHRYLEAPLRRRGREFVRRPRAPAHPLPAPAG